ncbi:AMP-binding protein [Bacillus sp. AK128]
MTIGQELLTYKHSQPNKAAIIYKNRTITYIEFINHIESIQNYLKRLYGEQNDVRIALKLGNEPAFLEVYYAAILLGYKCIPIDPKWTAINLENVLKTSKPELIVTAEVYEEMLRSPVTTAIEAIARPLDIFYIGFTSGSTGTPKGFQRHHYSWTESFDGCDQAFKLTDEDIFSAPGPLCHSLTLFAATYSLHIGATFVLTEKFESKELLESLVTNEVSVLFVVPTMLQAVINEDINSPILSLKKILSSGAKWNTASKNKIKSLFPKSERYEYYGASETSFISYLDENQNLTKPQSVGRAFPGVEVLIKDKEGNIKQPNEVGLLYIRSSMIFSGYLHDLQNKTQLEEITVGDLAYIDEEGFITLVGREKNMIISGGLNIYPEEIELHLKKLELIDEVVVTGKEDEYWGERVVAFIKWRDEQRLDDQFLKEHCLKELPAYKYPKVFYPVKTIPLTSSGKVDRNELLATMR